MVDIEGVDPLYFHEKKVMPGDSFGLFFVFRVFLLDRGHGKKLIIDI